MILPISIHKRVYHPQGIRNRVHLDAAFREKLIAQVQARHKGRSIQGFGSNCFNWIVWLSFTLQVSENYLNSSKRVGLV